MLKTTCSALLMAAALAPAHALTLDFGNDLDVPLTCTSHNSGTGLLEACNVGNFIAQQYGDVAGVVDVVYNAPRWGADRSLRWWNTAYNSLFGVLWADGSDGDSQGRIDLKPLAGNTITLQGFDLGAWANNSRTTSVSVSDLVTGTVLFSYSGAVGNIQGGANDPTHFALVDIGSANGLRIQWQDSAYNVGIDNIQFSAGVVPEPGAWALFAAGLLALPMLARRRRA